MSEEDKKIFKKCIQKILVHCISNQINLSWDNDHMSLNDIIELYTRRFVNIFDINKLDILKNDNDYSKIIHIFKDNLFLNYSVSLTNIETILDIIIEHVDIIVTSYKTSDPYIGVGTCCYCKDYCNPLSQACGPCIRRL